MWQLLTAAQMQEIDLLREEAARRSTYCARVERYGETSTVELIVADIAVREFDISDRPRAERLAQKINERLDAAIARASQATS